MREVIIENFMSYRYARIPFNSGLNIICGPNGSGKSSILLAISVALGQAYTERGKRLSDLIRWGEETARVTIVFDNTTRDGVRPMPRYDGDFFRLSRYLNRDGNYWYEANFQTISKSEVKEILKSFGINPDNMLIIMHQHMMMEFSMISPQKKLLMVEEAVGLGEYRRHILEAQEKLNRVLSEEESVSTLLKNAEQTLEYWKGEYERYQRRKELLEKKSFLERELAWAQLIRQERAVKDWEKKIWRKEEELNRIEYEIEENEELVKEFKDKLSKIQEERNKIYERLLVLEKEKAAAEEAVSSLQKTMDKIKVQSNSATDMFEEQILYVETVRKEDPLEAFQESEFINASSVRRAGSAFSGQELNEAIEKRLNEFQTQIKLLKQEAERLEKEKSILQSLMKDKEEKEEVLRAKKKRLEALSMIIDQVKHKLEVLEETRRQITLDESWRDGLVKELNSIVERLPPSIKIKPKDDLVALVEEISRKLQIEIESKRRLKESIGVVEEAIRTLTDEEQEYITAVQICSREIQVLRKKYAEVSLCMEGSEDKPQIRCDKCGSLLSPSQWSARLAEIGKEVKASEMSLNSLKQKLEDVTRRRSEKSEERDRLNEELNKLEVIHPLLIHVLQLKRVLENSCETIRKQQASEENVLKELSELVDLGAPQEIDSKIEQRAKALQTEARTLEIEVPRLEEAILNIEEMQIKPQHERVERALRASEEYQKMLLKMLEEFGAYMAIMEGELKSFDQKKLELEEKISKVKAELEKTGEKFNFISESYRKAASKNAVLSFQKEKAKSELDELLNELRRAQGELSQIQPLAEKMGPRIDTERTLVEISSDMKVIDAHLSMLTDVSEDVENMYMTYLNIFNELKEKALIVSENREKALIEVEERKKVWRSLLQSLFEKVNPTFKAYLEKIGATGWVRLINAQDLEEAGLELVVGFKGGDPHILDSQTQSGGEKSSATMAFLLALQRHIKSPLRAIDEFDVHMDPRNKEIVTQMLLEEIDGAESQYLIITPGQLTSVGEGVHVITVQRVEDTSEIKVVEAPLIEQ